TTILRIWARTSRNARAWPRAPKPRRRLRRPLPECELGRDSPRRPTRPPRPEASAGAAALAGGGLTRAGMRSTAARGPIQSPARSPMRARGSPARVYREAAYLHVAKLLQQLRDDSQVRDEGGQVRLAFCGLAAQDRRRMHGCGHRLGEVRLK